MTIEWQEPPNNPKTRDRKHIVELINELKKYPGRWACVRRGAPTGSDAPIPTLRRRGCEVTARKAEVGVDLYARWPKEAS